MSLGDLSSKLQDKISQDRHTKETITTDELPRLNETLLNISSVALHTTESAIVQRTEAMARTIFQSLARMEKNSMLLSRSLARAWFRNILLGTGIVLGVFIGTWTLTSLMTHRLDTLMKDITSLQGRKARLEQSVAIMEAQAWGIQLMESEQGRFLILPEGMTLKPGWRIGDLPALKLE